MSKERRVDRCYVLVRELGAHRRMAGRTAPYIRTLYMCSTVYWNGIYD